MQRHLKEVAKAKDVVQCVGIAADEEYRLERKANARDGIRFPLVEWTWTEKDCLEYCYSKGFDWEGLYEIFDRVSCWCCPLKSLEELRKLQTHFPELWNELKEMDNRSWNQFRPDFSVYDLEIRFKLEKEFEQSGKSIRSKEFYEELRKRLVKK